MLSVGSCEVRVPARPLTAFHLLIDLPGAAPEFGRLSPDQGADLIRAYRKARQILAAAGGCDGFNVCLAYRWRPLGDGIGEPEYEGNHPQLHVFGRSRDEDASPIRILSRPVSARHAARRGQFAFDVPPTDAVTETDPVDCACCVPSVEREQELWRRDGVRVIRPHVPVVRRNVLVLPLRHVASPAALTAAEICSIWDRLAETIEHLGATGLSVFLNDGERASQHIPHVHIHVFGRSPDETENPFLVLGRR